MEGEGEGGREKSGCPYAGSSQDSRSRERQGQRLEWSSYILRGVVPSHQIAAEVSALREEVSQQRDVMDSVAKEKDIAIATLKIHNLYQDFLNHLEEVKGHVSKPSHDSSAHIMLSQQNEQLKSVISSMRKEMEQLSLQPPGQSMAGESPGGSHGYMKYLERELVSVKSENRYLRAQQGGGGRGGGGGGGEGGGGREATRPPHPPQFGGGDERLQSSTPSPTKHSHLLAMSEAIAVLQKEKKAVELRVIWLQHTLRAAQTSLRAREEEVRAGLLLTNPPLALTLTLCVCM